MSIFADCALRVSFTRIGSACALISWSLPLLFGYSTTVTAVTFPPETVICTWTGPQRVSAAVPVTVVLPELAVPVLDEDGAAAVPEVDDVPVSGASAEALPPAAAVALEDVEVW